jgi:hypothetical protein
MLPADTGVLSYDNMYPKRIVQTVKQKCKYFRQNMTNVIAFFAGILGNAGTFYSQWGLIPRNPLTRGSFRAVRISKYSRKMVVDPTVK